MHPCSSGILKGMGSWLEELWLPDHGSDHGSDPSCLISPSGIGLAQMWPSSYLAQVVLLVNELPAELSKGERNALLRRDECIQKRHLFYLSSLICRSVIVPKPTTEAMDLKQTD